MAIVAGFDVHRAQITFDALDTDTGEVSRGRIDATPTAVARWTQRFDGCEIDVAVEACTGWLFVCDALVAAGAVPHLAEPVETRALRGRKRRAKTDREDARWLRELRQLARRQTGCKALMRLYGMGELTSLVTLCELGDVTRLSASRKAVRMAGIDIGVHRSDRRSRVGKLTRQGSPQLRWALYEAALSACRPSSPDHADYLALKARGLSHTRASLTIARKLARRSYHALRELGPAALDPITTS